MADHFPLSLQRHLKEHLLAGVGHPMFQVNFSSSDEVILAGIVIEGLHSEERSFHVLGVDDELLIKFGVDACILA